MRRSITALDLDERRTIRFKLFAGRFDWGRGLFVLFSLSIFATAALEVVVSLAAPYLAAHGRELTACLVGLLYGHLTGFNPIDVSDVLDPAHLAPPDILARWIYLPFLGLISLGLSLPTVSIRGFLNPTGRQFLAAGAALASLLYAALLLAHPVSAAFYGACPCQINWQASLDVMADLRWGYYVALAVAIVNVILNEFSTQIEAYAVRGEGNPCKDAKAREDKQREKGKEPVGPPPVGPPPVGPAPTPTPVLAPDVFPPRLAELGFVGRTIGGVAVITPPVCLVKAGPFLMGSDLFRDTNAEYDERDQHTMYLGAFQIARYPVTVAEYDCFVRTGHSEPNDWANQNQDGHRDHPVVNITLDDAVAYVQWLEAREAAEAKGKKREWHWRLPTEAQWEKAARGTDGRIYPWGDAFDVIRCDTAESGNLATMPVGTYPTGASPRGALDMAGNVWEWTRSLYRRYHYRAGDGREPDMDVPMPPALGGPFYVLRGGSWKSSWTQARAAYRDQRMPDIVCDDVGFRLVIAPAQAT